MTTRLVATDPREARGTAREALHAARNRLFARHPQTTFIAAHLGNDGEDLQETARLLEDYPNVYLEFVSRIAELGRQPYTARDFLMHYQDRILFGTDGPWPEQRYGYYWRFLETRDEYFPYAEKPFPPQGLWRAPRGDTARWPGVRWSHSTRSAGCVR